MLADRTRPLDLRLGTLLAHIEAHEDQLDRFLVRTEGRIHFVNVDEIDWLEAANNYVKLHVADRSFVVRYTMKRLQERLDPKRFVRIHRSAIVSISRIGALRPFPGGDYEVVLKTGVKLTLSRGYQKQFRDRVGWPD